jgi:hypothetical protein
MGPARCPASAAGAKGARAARAPSNAFVRCGWVCEYPLPRKALRSCIKTKREDVWRRVSFRLGRRPYGAHALRGSRNSSQELFDNLAAIKTDPEMVQLATQLVQRQSGEYD